jgi:acetate---CoA ligase (ADP-forming)
VYDVLHQKMKTCRKPIFPVLPSTLTAREEVDAFIAKGRINFPDEVTLGNALCRVYHSPRPVEEKIEMPVIDVSRIRQIIDNAPEGYLAPEQVQGLLDAAGIPRAGEAVADTLEGALKAADTLGYPLVMKVVGPVHKSDVGGVVLNVKDTKGVEKEFTRMMQIKDTTAILMQPMLSGTELFAGAKREEKFGHMVLCGMGGIFIEVLKDVSSALSPVSNNEALGMIRNLKSYKIIQGVRGQQGISEEKFAMVLQRLSALLEAAPEIYEMDLNPLLGKGEQVVAVDARINVSRE